MQTDLEWAVGDMTGVAKLAAEAHDLAIAVGDNAAAANASWLMSFPRQISNTTEAARLCERAIREAEASGDISILVVTRAMGALVPIFNHTGPDVVEADVDEHFIAALAVPDLASGVARVLEDHADGMFGPGAAAGLAVPVRWGGVLKAFINDRVVPVPLLCDVALHD